MDDRKLALRMIKEYVPEAAEDEAFMRYLKEHLDTYYDYGHLEEVRNSLRQSAMDCVSEAREDYNMLTEPVHRVEVDPEKQEIHFGEYVLPAYWYKKGMPKQELERIKLSYKRIWEKLDYGEICFPMLQDWHPLEAWRERYSEDALRRMERDLEAREDDQALRLYYMYVRRESMMGLERKYPDKIQAILSIENRDDSGEERTADLTLLLYDGSTCSVRVGTDSHGRYCSTTALSRPGFPMFTDEDAKLIQRTVFDSPSANG